MRWSSALLIAAGFGYALYAIGVLVRLRYTTVHGDFWIIYDRFFEIPFPGNVLAPENSHSMVLPSLIWLANMIVFRGDETPLFAIALASLVTIAALLIEAVLRDRGRGSAERTLLIASALAATFWLAKLQILLSAGFTMICAFPMIGLLLGVRSLTSIAVGDSRRRIRWPVWAGAVLSTFSFGTGLAAWPALGLIAWARRVPWRSLGSWCLGMLVCLLVIQGILPRWVPERDQAFPSIILAPLENLEHWLQLLGSPVANTWAGLVHAQQVDARLALGAGIAGASLAGWGLLRAWSRRRDLTQAEWTGAALVLFAAGAAGLIAIGRTSAIRYFPGDQFSSRYLWWTAYFWLGVIWLLAGSGRLSPALRTRVQLGAAVLCLAGVWPAHQAVLGLYEHQRAKTESFVASLVSGGALHALLSQLAPRAATGLSPGRRLAGEAALLLREGRLRLDRRAAGQVVRARIRDGIGAAQAESLLLERSRRGSRGERGESRRLAGGRSGRPDPAHRPEPGGARTGGLLRGAAAVAGRGREFLRRLRARNRAEQGVSDLGRAGPGVSARDPPSGSP